MSSPSINQCRRCHRFLDGGGSKSLRGTCEHLVCISCIENADAERRRSNDVAVGPYLPCPVPSCYGGRFEVPEGVGLSGSDSEVIEDEEVYSSPTVDRIVSSSGSAMTPPGGEVRSRPDATDADEPSSGGSISLSSPAKQVTSSTTVVVTPVPDKVKSESQNDRTSEFQGDYFNAQFNNEKVGVDDSDDYSRFSEVSDDRNCTDPKKEETDDEGEDRASRFSGGTEDDEESRFSYISDLGDPEDTSQGNEQADPSAGGGDGVQVKEEPTDAGLQKKQAKVSRIYGDRVLLARQSAVGMMKLGGGNQSSLLYPKDDDQRMKRMGGRYCMAYSCHWNFGAPKYAGQPSAHVTHLPDAPNCDFETTPFSVFVMRWVGGSSGSTLGWEYCGDYVLFNDIRGTTAARCVPQSNKKRIIRDAQRSLSCPNGIWHTFLGRKRGEILAECEADPTEPGPRLIRLINNLPEPDDEGEMREARLERESRERATNAAKARALGLNDESLPDMDFVKLLLRYDDFYGSYAIQFVSYDEEMYQFVKDGMTTKNRHNKKRGPGEQCAKTSDWYGIDDQQLEQNDREEKKRRDDRKRKHP